MRVVEIPRPGPPEVLAVRERPALAPRDGEIVISVRAAGVNFADLMGRLGLYPEAPGYPYVPGYEVAGVVRGTDRRVMAATRFGGYAEEVVLPEAHAVPIPDSLTFAEAAAIPVNYLTAWIALVEMARVRAGDRVLVHSAAGGVGIAAIQITHRYGATVLGLVGTPEKAEFLRGIGVARPIVRGVDPMPEPGTVDILLDPTGPTNVEESLALVSPAGRVVLYGAQEIVTGRRRNVFKVLWRMRRYRKLSPIRLMHANRGVYGLNMLRLFGDLALLRRAMDGILAGVREGWVKPRVDRTFPLERAADAHTHLQDRKNIGKVVLTTGAS